MLTLFFSLLAGFATESAVAALLLLLPVSELVKNVLDFVLSKTVPPRRIARMELADGVPPEGKTVCVVSVLLTSAKSAPGLARNLEEFRLSNRDCGKNLLFGLLADFPEGMKKTLPGDAAVISAAQDAVDGLNEKYGGGFYLFSRSRQYSRSDKKWFGRERKRGALLALARLLSCGESERSVLSGDPAALSGARYIITLDADTRLTPGTARELVGAMLHPLNKPVIDSKKGVVTSGYGVIHPRIGVELRSATQSGFSRLFAGQGGCDPYGSSCGELYMDLFDRGGFAGKGIIDADALIRCTGDLPENLILSHDAVEGAILRGGYMNDAELMDGFPASPLGYYRRMHRWTRGDWQNIPFIFSRGRNLSDVDRWTLLDSLRRSLVAPLTFAAIFFGFLMPERGIVLAASAARLANAAHLLLTLAENSLRPENEAHARYHSTIIHGAAGALVQTIVRLILLPVDAWICASAILTALFRLFCFPPPAPFLADRRPGRERKRKRPLVLSAPHGVRRCRGRGGNSSVHRRYRSGRRRGLAFRALLRLLARPARAGSAPGAGGRQNLSDRALAGNLALLRDVLHQVLAFPAAGQLAGAAAYRRGAAHLPDEHRACPRLRACRS